MPLLNLVWRSKLYQQLARLVTSLPSCMDRIFQIFFVRVVLKNSALWYLTDTVRSFLANWVCAVSASGTLRRLSFLALYQVFFALVDKEGAYKGVLINLWIDIKERVVKGVLSISIPRGRSLICPTVAINCVSEFILYVSLTTARNFHQDKVTQPARTHSQPKKIWASNILPPLPWRRPPPRKIQCYTFHYVTNPGIFANSLRSVENFRIVSFMEIQWTTNKEM